MFYAYTHDTGVFCYAETPTALEDEICIKMLGTGQHLEQLRRQLLKTEGSFAFTRAFMCDEAGAPGTFRFDERLNLLQLVDEQTVVFPVGGVLSRLRHRHRLHFHHA